MRVSAQSHGFVSENHFELRRPFFFAAHILVDCSSVLTIRGTSLVLKEGSEIIIPVKNSKEHLSRAIFPTKQDSYNIIKYSVLSKILFPSDRHIAALPSPEACCLFRQILLSNCLFGHSWRALSECGQES